MRIKKALITGAGKGIGAAIAKCFAQQGIHVYLHYFQSEEQVLRVREDCAESGVEAIICRADLRQYEELESLFEQLPSMPDIVINNAGMEHYGPFLDIRRKDWEELLNVNARSAFLCSQWALPHMLRNGFGRIINISSIWGVTGASNEVLYSLTKGALHSFTKALAKEAAVHGITVNAVAPGVIDTDMNRHLTLEERDMLLKLIPLQRFGNADEVASLVCFLASEQASYITGQVIDMDGGLQM